MYSISQSLRNSNFFEGRWLWMFNCIIQNNAFSICCRRRLQLLHLYGHVATLSIRREGQPGPAAVARLFVALSLKWPATIFIQMLVPRVGPPTTHSTV